jgi:hypothetical protein
LCFVCEQALSIDPINAHLLELLNMALESITVLGPGNTTNVKMLAVGSEFKSALMSLRAKYEKHRGELEVEEGHEMHVG